MRSICMLTVAVEASCLEGCFIELVAGFVLFIFSRVYFIFSRVYFIFSSVYFIFSRVYFYRVYLGSIVTCKGIKWKDQETCLFKAYMTVMFWERALTHV